MKNCASTLKRAGGSLKAFAGLILFLMPFLSIGQTVETFPASGSWLAPAGVTSVIVECWGGGGAGGSVNVSGGTGGGGAGGAYARKTLTVVPGTTYNFTVATATTANGSTGNDSWFGSNSTVLAKGGPGAANVTTAIGGTGGSWTSNGSIGDIVYNGGNGGSGAASGNSGAGGGGAGSSGAGGNATGSTAGLGTADNGGNGAVGLTANGSGTAGLVYGGGGSGGKANNTNIRNGGAGAAGFIRLTYTAIIGNVPTVTSFSPASVCTGSGSTITITGTNFSTATAVEIGGVVLSSTDFTIVSATEITVALPATAITGSIKVTNPDGTGTGSTNLTVSPLTVGGTVSGGATVCSGSNVTLTLAGSIGSILNWESSSDATFTSPVNISNTTNTLIVSNVTTSNYYRAVVQSGVCAVEYSSASLVTVNASPDVSNFSVSATSSVAQNASAVVTLSSTSLASGNYTITYNMSGANTATGLTASVTFASGSATFNTPVLANLGNTTITVASVENADNCSVSVSTGNTATVNVEAADNCPVSTVVAPSANQSTCIGGAIAQLTATITTNGISGTPTLKYQWYYNTTNSNLVSSATKISGATSANYTPLSTVAALGTRYYFCAGYADDNNCGQNDETQSMASNTVEVTISSSTQGGTISGGTAVCSGNNSTTLHLSGFVGNILSWESSSDANFTSPVIISNTSDSLVVAGLSSTTYYRAVVQDGSCAIANSTPATVSVNPIPTVTASASLATVCSGSQITLTGGGANSFTWDNGAVDGIAFTITSTTTFTVTGTDANGCINTAQTTVTVIQTPTVTASASSASVCAGGQVTLTAAGASAYSWTGGVTDGIAFTPSATDTYTVTGTATNGCTNTAQVTVTVNPVPTVTANTTSATVCAGSQVTLTGGGASTYSWSGGVTNGVAFTPTSTNTYTVTGTATNGCTNTAQVTVTVNQLPTVTANTTAATVCAGAQVTLTGGGASTYSWSGGVTNGVAFAPSATDTYTVTGTGTNGCTNTAQVTVTVNTSPTVLANATSTKVCAGTLVTLTGSGASTYTWNNGVSDNSAFAPSATATYTVTGTAANGCTSTASITINVDALPVVTAMASTLIVCDGNAVTLTAGGADIYAWDNGITNGVAFSANTAVTTYTVTGTDANGCVNTATVNLTVNPLPVVVANASALEICDGSSVVLSGTGADVHIWSHNVLDNIPFVPTATETYTVTGTDANGCTNTAQITITVNPLPTVTASATATTVCAGQNISLFASNITDATYAWTGPNNYSSNQQNPSIINATTAASGTYSVTATVNGCSNTAPITITVNPLPTVTASATATTVCAGQNISLFASNITDATYAWTGPNNYSSNQQNPSIINATTAASGTYSVAATANGCSNTAQITVNVNALPVVAYLGDTTCVDYGAFDLEGGLPVGGNYSSSAGTITSFDPSVSGVGEYAITYTFTDANQCTNSATANMVVKICLGVEELPSNLASVKVYPNPSFGRFTVEVVALSNEDAQLVIYTAGGITVKEEKLNLLQGENKLSYSLDNHAPGIYFIRIVTNSGNLNHRVVKN
jgi:hypothetical protein